MKTKVYLSIVFATALIGTSITSCLKKPTNCKCVYASGKKDYYDLKYLDNKSDSCRVLDQQAEMNEGNCYLK